MKLLMLLGLCALALARIPSSSWEQEHYPEFNIQENVFRPGKEYKFKYDGQLATGIPQSSRQHSATRIQALVSILFKNNDQCLLQIEQVRVGRLNRRIPNPRAIMPFLTFEEVEISQPLETKLKAPLKFRYTNGMISDVVFDGREEAWSANIKRGILNMLQVNLQKTGRTDQSELARLTNRVQRTETPELDFFSVMEPTLEGQCETLYTVTAQPSPRYSSGPVLNVTKSIDFEKCQKRPDIKYNWRFEDPCPTCESKYSEDQKFLKASTIAKYNISGTKDEFCIESAIVESQYNFVPFNREGNMMTTYVNQSLVLVYSGEPQLRISQPRNPQQSDSDMIYSPDWDIAKEALFMNGEEEFLRDTPYSELKNKKQFVKEILRRLISEMSESVQEEAPRQYLRLVKILRMLKLSQLEEIHSSFFSQAGPFTPEQHLKIKNLLVDALADAGTKDSISHLVRKIKNKEISPIRAAVSIKSLINCRVVSKEMIEEMMDLAESPVCQKNWFLKQSVYLTMGSMINALCQQNKDKLASEFKTRPQRFCPREFQQQLVEKMFSKYQSARTYGDKVVYMKTIANMGLELSVFELEKIIKSIDSTETPLLRMEAIFALRQISHTMPRKVQQICMPVFMNRQVPTEVRISCVYTLLQTKPSRPILDQMARKLHSERNRQVTSFIYSYMITMANSTNPCFKKMARDLQLSLRHGQRIGHAFYPSYSQYVHASLNSQKYRMGANINLGSIYTNKSPIPRVLAADVSANFLGMWNNHLFTYGIVNTNMEGLLQKYLGNRGYWNEMDLEDVLIRNPRSASQSPKQVLKKLWQKLKTVQRNLPNQPEGYVFLKFKDQDFGVLPFNIETMTESFSDFIKEGRVNLREIEKFLESGYNFHLYKAALLHEMSYKIPTTLGMPLVVSIKMPTVMQLTGQIKAKITNRWQKAKVELVNTKPSMVTAVVSDIQIWSPISNSGLKVVGLAKVFTPINGEAEFDLTSSPAELVVKYRPPQQPVQWLHIETRPITYTRVWPKFLKTWQEPQEQTLRGEEWTRMYNFEKDFPIVKKFEEFCEQSLGVKVFLQGLWHHTPAMRLQSTPFCPLSGPNKLYLRTQPTPQQPKVVIAKLSGSVFSEQSSPLRFSEQMESFLEEEQEQMESQWRSYSSPKHYHSQINAEIFTKGGKQVRAELDAKVKCEPSLRLCKFESKVQRSPIPQWDSQPFKMCVDSEYLYPETPYSFSQLAGKKILGSLKTTWGQSCQSSNYVHFKVLAQRSRQQREMIQREPEYQYYSEENCESRPERCSPVSQYRSLVKASRLNSLKMEAEWQNVSPRVQNITQKVYRAIKTALYWNSEVNSINIQHPSNKVQVRLSLDAENQRYLNVTVKTPKEKAIFRDLPLPIPVRSPLSLKRSTERISSFRSLIESLSSQVSPVCNVHSRHIKTFDGERYSVPISTCWSVLAKDCYEQNFAVLIKKLSQESSQKKIKIVVPSHQITLEPQQSQIKVVVNGEEQELSEVEPLVFRSHSHQVVRIEKTGPYVKVNLVEAGVRVYFDGYAANIKMSPMLQNIQCGLCGHYDNEPSDEWRNPEMEQEYDVRRFFQSYTLKEQQCEYPQEVEQICKTSECLSQSPNWEDERQRQWSRSSSWESQSQEEEESSSSEEQQEQRFPRESFRPVQRTKLIEQNGKICFSKSPVPRCPHHSYPIEHQQRSRKVAYTCLPRDDPEVESLLIKIRSQRQTPQRLESLPTTFSETETLPQRCRRL